MAHHGKYVTFPLPPEVNFYTDQWFFESSSSQTIGEFLDELHRDVDLDYERNRYTLEKQVGAGWVALQETANVSSFSAGDVVRVVLD